MDIIQSKWRQEAKARVWDEVWAKYNDDFTDHESAQDLEQAHLCWCRAATEYLCELQSERPTFRLDEAIRGTIMNFKKRSLTARLHANTMTTAGVQANIVAKAIGRCKEIARRMKAFFEKTLAKPANQGQTTTTTMTIFGAIEPTLSNFCRRSRMR